MSIIVKRFKHLVAITCLAALMAFVCGCGLFKPVKGTSGAEPVVADAIGQAARFMQQSLKDYDSAKIEWGDSLTLVKAGAVEGVDWKLGDHWLLTARVNAKNSYGGYIGWITVYFRFQGGVLVNVSDIRDTTYGYHLGE